MYLKTGVIEAKTAIRGASTHAYWAFSLQSRRAPLERVSTLRTAAIEALARALKGLARGFISILLYLMAKSVFQRRPKRAIKRFSIRDQSPCPIYSRSEVVKRSPYKQMASISGAVRHPKLVGEIDISPGGTSGRAAYEFSPLCFALTK